MIDESDENHLNGLEFPVVINSGEQPNFGKDLTAKQVGDLVELFHKFEPIFSDQPGETHLIEHSIELNTPDPIHVKPYPIPFAKVKAAEEEIDKMIEMEIIEPSKSPYCAPLLLVHKKDGTHRPGIDFRRLNTATKFDSEPIPNRDGIFAKLSGICFFTKLDFCKGYWQMPMTTSDREETAFSTPKGLYQFRRMPFGLVNAGASYSRMMRILLEGIDDVHSRTSETHLATLEQVFERVQRAGLTLKPSKCYLGNSSVDIRNYCLHTQGDKVAKIRDAEIPTNKTQVRAFLGLTGYYQRFIPNYAHIAAPLSDLTKKGRPESVKWSK